MGIKNKIVGLYFGIMVCHGASSYAELLIDPVNKIDVGKGETGAFFGNSTIEYSYSELLQGLDSKDSTGDIKRQYISAYFAYGLSKNIDIFGIGGYVFNVEPEDESGSSSDGTGFLFGGGARGNTNFNVISGIDIYWYAQLLMYKEDYGTWHIEIENYKFNFSLEGSIKELSVGAIATKSVGQEMTLYAGPEFVFYKDGDLDWTISGFNYNETVTIGYERDNSFGFRLGAKKEFGGLIFNINTAFMNESSFSIGIIMPLGRNSSGSTLGSTFFRSEDMVKSQTIEKELTTEDSGPDFGEKRDAGILTEVQRRLAEQGYSPGPVDGIMGEKTMLAIEKYQRDNGLKITKYPDEQLLKSLGIR